MNASVTLVRNGDGRTEYALRERSTLADLRREAGVDPMTAVGAVDGKPLEASIPLRPGMIVRLSPRPERGLGGWQSTLGMFRDDPGFAAFMERVEASCQDEDSDTESPAK